MQRQLQDARNLPALSTHEGLISHKHPNRVVITQHSSATGQTTEPDWRRTPVLICRYSQAGMILVVRAWVLSRRGCA